MARYYAAKRQLDLGAREPRGIAQASRQIEDNDAMMLREDPRAIANMPQQVIYREFPKHNYYLPDIVGYGMSVQDEQMGGDHSQAMKKLDPLKY